MAKIRRHFLIHHLPKWLVYGFCVRYFLANVLNLWSEFRRYETNVVVTYSVPGNLSFPAVTVCGCCLQRATTGQADRRGDRLFWHEYGRLANHSAMDILDRFSYGPDRLLPDGYQVEYAGQPGQQHRLASDQHLLQSIHHGRKCFTYFSADELYLASAQFQLSWPEDQPPPPPAAAGLQSDLVAAVHAADTLPSSLDVNFFRVDPGTTYQVQYKLVVTQLQPPPFRTRCHVRRRDQMPRSQNQCINQCIMEETAGRPNCINYYAMASRDLVRSGLRFCPRRGYLHYYRFIVARRRCHGRCSRDCRETVVSAAVDLGPAPNDSVSRLVITANRQIVPTVRHEGAMSLFELAGYLAGHAHLWLGLYALQLYDLVARLLRRCLYRP